VILTGLHLLLTYQCNYECDHCFVWGSPSQKGVMTLAQVRAIYRQAQELGTVEWIYLEGDLEQRLLGHDGRGRH